MVVRHHKDVRDLSNVILGFGFVQSSQNQNKLSQKCRKISASRLFTFTPVLAPQTSPKRSPATFAVNHLTTVAVSIAGAIGVQIRADTADLERAWVNSGDYI